MTDDELLPIPVSEPPAEPPIELEPGYYRCVAADDHFAEGELVYLLGIEDGRASFVRGEHRWTTPPASFAAQFEFDPEGVVHRSAEMARVMAEIGELQAQSLRDTASLRTYNPHVDEAGAATGMALVPSGERGAIAAKRSIADIRNLATRTRRELEARSAELKAFAEEQSIILRAQTSGLQAILAKAEEAIWTVNLYLGTDEEIVRLAEGAPAPADEPITIRQLVLYMDEESAIAAEEGGIDARGIEDFDAWLTADPRHLAQVLPEPKGMVALKPRRTAKDYRTDNPWAEAQLNKENRRIYFLLRNGGNLYRMWTSFDVGERLIPKTDEFTAYFRNRVHNYETHQDEEVILKPGSDAFMRAEKEADAKRRHYMRAALILQGLIDRTTIFAPMAWRINVADQASYIEALRVVLDADAMLSDGRERFETWFARINGELDLGMRIVGAFGSYEHGLPNYRGERTGNNERLSPPRADYPPSDALYTLEDRRDGGFVFYYKREGMRWDSALWREVPYEKRAACLVMASDKFILNFDAATEDEMRFYLRSRLDRHTYSYLFPALKLGLAMKAAEREAEAPFRLLLAGEIAKAHGVDLETASAAVPELVRWWKLKNRTHRALASDDAKALRMIVDEFGHRAEQAGVREKARATSATMLARILAAEPAALLVAHKAGSEYVALVPANNEDVFAHEQIWTARGRREVREWRTVDSRHERWEILHRSARWDGWKIGAARLEHLSDPERAALVERGWAALRVALRYRAEHYSSSSYVELVPLAASANRKNEITLYFDGPRTAPPTERLLTNPMHEPRLSYSTLGWKRDGSRRPMVTTCYERETTVIEHFGDQGRPRGSITMPWERGTTSMRSGRADRASLTLLWIDEAAVARLREHLAAYQRYQRTHEALESKVWTAHRALDQAYVAAQERVALAKFLADFGDVDLWEGHRKALKIMERLPGNDVRQALGILVERGIDVAGRSAGEIVDEANELAGRKLTIPEAIRDIRPAAKATTATGGETTDKPAAAPPAPGATGDHDDKEVAR